MLPYQLYLHALSGTRGNALCTGTVSFTFWLFAGYVTPFCLRLLFMHNLRRPFFPQYDMPEKYDLARTIFGGIYQTHSAL